MSLSKPVPANVNFKLEAEGGVAPSTAGVARQAQNDMLAILQTQLGTAPEAAGTISGGVASIVSAVARLDTEGAAASDSVTRFNLDNIAEGRIVIVSATSAARVITIEHLGAGGAQAGECDLAAAADAVLDQPYKRVMLIRRGNRMVEIARFGFASVGTGGGSTGLGGQAIADIALGNYSITGGVLRHRDEAATSYTLDPTDAGYCLNFTANVVVTLPTSVGSWQIGNVVYWRQGGSSMRVVAAVGGMVSPLNHDRGAGVGSRGAFIVTRVDSSSGTPKLVWDFVGLTAAPPSAGAITRTYVSDFKTTSFKTADGSTAYEQLCSVTHTPGDNERWVYISRGWLNMGPNNGSNPGSHRLRNATGSDGPRNPAPRYGIHFDTAVAMLGASYGTSPGSQTILTEHKAGATTTGSNSNMERPGLIGLRLEAGEFLYLGPASTSTASPHDTAVDVISASPTLAADDYLILAFANVVAATNGRPVTAQLSVDGTVMATKNAGTHSTLLSAYFAVKPFTVTTAGAKTIKLQIKSPDAAIQATASNACLAILRKSLFQTWFVSESAAAADTTASGTTWADKLTYAPALAAGWEYLLLADSDLTMPAESAEVAGLWRVQRDSGSGGATLGREAVAGTRWDATAGLNPAAYLAVVQKQSTTGDDTYKIQYASRRATDVVTIDDTTLAFLALKAV